jgi:hypothetical protein
VVYKKLTNPFAKRRNAGTQRRIAGRAKKSDKMRKTDDNKSIMLSTSPIITNGTIPSTRGRH